MKFTNLTKVSVLLLALGFAFSSCTDLSVDNLNDPSREDALGKASDLVSLLQGQTLNQFSEEQSFNGISMDGWADQMTSTNNANELWDYADQPRRRLNNRTSWAGSWTTEYDWTESNSSISTANTIISKIEVDGESIVFEDGTDVTQKMLAGAYFLRGLARGSLGMTYNQAYLLEADAEIGSEVPEFVPYTQVIDGAVSDMDKAISIAEGVGSSFTYDLLPSAASMDLSLAEFKDVANSFSARFLANMPRTPSEAQNMDWSKVLTYADKGLGGDNSASSMENYVGSSIGGSLYSFWAYFSQYMIASTSSYIHRDIKHMHLLDPSYPTDYPQTTGPDGAPIPDEQEEDDWNTDDPRAQYYEYGTFGFLRASRSIPLHSNYNENRHRYGNDYWSANGLPYTVFIQAEMQYIRAEAHLMKGEKVSAAQILNNSPFGSGQTDITPNMEAVQVGNMSQDGFSGGNSISATASDAEFVHALHKEYTVELGLTDRKGLTWFFMRRHDLLQPGTPLHFPIPGSELEVTKREYYTFGGPDYAGDKGTATGSNDWRNSNFKMLQKSADSEGKYNGAQASEEFLNRLQFNTLQLPEGGATKFK